jgi:hypothetical protein
LYKDPYDAWNAARVSKNGSFCELDDMFQPRGSHSGPELTNWRSGTHKRTKQERHAALGNGAPVPGSVRSGRNPSVFSDVSCWPFQT